MWKLIHNPLSVSDLELTQIFQLRRSLEDTLPQPGVHTIYYVRTFPLRASQLNSIIMDWCSKNREFDVLPCWGHQITLANASPQQDPMVYIRYVGMAGKGKTGWNRFEEDLKGRKNGLMAEFLSALVNSYPDAFDRSQIHEFLDASFPVFPTPNATFLDDRERVLITLFNRSLLLNQQSGGYYPSYLPRESDHALFAKLGCHFFDTYGKMVDTRDEIGKIGIQQFVNQWGDELMLYAQEHPIETLTNRFPITEEHLENVIKRQAVANLVGGSSLIALVGKDVTIEDLVGENTFLSGSSRAGKLTLELLSRIHQFENNFGQLTTNPFIDGQFPFVDVFPWIGKTEPEVGVEFVRRYLEGTQPRIVVTFSRFVSSWVASDFVHAYGLPTYVNPRVS